MVVFSNSCSALGNEMQIILNSFHSLSYSRQQLLCLRPIGHEYRDKRDQGQTHLYNIFLFSSTILWPVRLKEWGAYMYIHHTSCNSYNCLNIFRYMTMIVILLHLCRFSLLCNIFITTILWQLLWIWGTIHRRTYCLHKETVLWGMTW